jgi:xanthine/uracil permease
MIAGLITPPIIFASALNLPGDLQAYMISASLIASGILSAIQMSRFHLFKGYYLGTGLLTVVGTSFATLSTAFAIFNALYADGTCTSTTAADGTVTRDPCPDAYGALIGTTLVTSFLEMLLSFVPPAKLKRIFPPIVTGVTVV